jgi:hypothetical protein
MLNFASIKQYKFDVLAITALALLIVVVFYKTVFLGILISHASLLANADSLFSAQATGIKQSYDPMIYRLHVPYYFMVSQQLQNLHLHLWNPLSGAGCPLIGDIQTLALSPLQFLLSPWASLHVYSLLMILYLVICAAGTYLLSRTLKLSRFAAVFSAATYSFCPFILFFLEPPTGPSECLYPLIFWLFARLACKPSLKRCVAAAIGYFVLIVSGHVQYTFWGIAFASMLMVVLMLAKKNFKGHGSGAAMIPALALTALLAFLFSAPVLLPFLEYLKNSDCYKTAVAVGSYRVPWQGVTFSLLHPGFDGGSPYLGAVAILLLPLAAFTRGFKRKLLGSIVLLDLLAFAIVCRPGPLSLLCYVPPFSWLQDKYCIAICMLLTAVIAGFGFEQCASKFRWGANPRSYALALTAVTIAFTPLAIKAAHLDISSISLDPFLPVMSVSNHALVQTFLVIAAVVAILIFRSFNKSFPAVCIAVLIILCSLGSELAVAKSSLPEQASFAYTKDDPVSFLKAKQERILNFGKHVFVPSSNFVFGISNLASINVLWPARSLSFISEAGGSTVGTDQVFQGRLSRLVDLASVKYVVSQLPVLSTDDSVPSKQVVYDPVNHDVCGKVTWSAPSSVAPFLRYQTMVVDHRGNLLWFGDVLAPCTPPGTSSTPVSQNIYAENLLAAVPPDLDPQARFTVAVRLIDSRTNAVFKSLTVYDSRSSSVGRSRHFKLISVRKNDYIRVYENPHALPQVYIVHQTWNAKTAAEALKAIESPNFNPQNAAVIEGVKESAAGSLVNNQNESSSETISWRRSDFDHVVIDAALKNDGFVVLTDTYYPGWYAYIDGKPTEILRANYLFRALAVPTGHHHISFSYEPLSFRIGMILAIAGVVLSIVLFTRK